MNQAKKILWRKLNSHIRIVSESDKRSARWLFNDRDTMAQLLRVLVLAEKLGIISGMDFDWRPDDPPGSDFVIEMERPLKCPTNAPA